ncbi:hypothetical protein PLICRDRAFT_44312 [Plicaturopsis crispa FD-325 SS-3]|nr:hypothetical protein PLICRDRAFT_44312 [Plicaturopsis crispa FD-325 SS-3]
MVRASTTLFVAALAMGASVPSSAAPILGAGINLARDANASIPDGGNSTPSTLPFLGSGPGNSSGQGNETSLGGGSGSTPGGGSTLPPFIIYLLNMLNGGAGNANATNGSTSGNSSAGPFLLPGTPLASGSSDPVASGMADLMQFLSNLSDSNSGANATQSDGSQS